jgi:hypothetical protein
MNLLRQLMLERKLSSFKLARSRSWEFLAYHKCDFHMRVVLAFHCFNFQSSSEALTFSRFSFSPPSSASCLIVQTSGGERKKVLIHP